MLVAVQRWIVLVVALLTIGLAVVLLFSLDAPARMGMNTQGGTAGTFTIRSVVPGSAAADAGVRARETCRLKTTADVAASTAHVPGARVTLVCAGARDRTIVLRRAPLTQQQVIDLLMGMFFPLLAIVIALRSWTDAQARRLAIAFLWILLFVGQSYAFQHPQAQTAIGFAAIAMIAWGMANFAFFSLGYRATPDRLREVGRPCATGLAVCFLAISLVDLSASTFFHRPIPTVMNGVEASMWAISMGGSLVALLAAFVRAAGVERRRIGWVVLTVAVGLGPSVVYEPIRAFTPGISWPWYDYMRLLLPLGLAYATLRHRVVDIGFALNRAAVFAATTALLLGLFGGLQWAADRVLVEVTRTQGVAVQLTIVVIVLYAARLARAQTEAFVARVLFAHRRRRIDAVLRIAREVDEVETVDALAPFVVERLRAESAIDSSLYLESGEAFARVAGTTGPEIVARDSPIVIALRAARSAMAVRDGDGVPGAIAFPLAVRNRLRGAIVCSPPIGDDEFAPDERDALTALATRTAIARDDLLAQALRGELAQLREENGALLERNVGLTRENVLLNRLVEAGGRAVQPVEVRPSI